MWFSVIFLSLGISCVYTQAPGDFNKKCRKPNQAGINIRDFPDNWKVIMDTSDYVELYSSIYGPVGPFWVNKDLDGDFLSYFQIGGACSALSYVCYGFALQNNWLFSQYISYANSREIFVNATYAIHNCNSDLCIDDYFTVYRQDANNTLNSNKQEDPDRYKPCFGSFANSLLDEDHLSNGKTMTFVRPPSSEGFHLGIKDGGTCGELGRILIYYTICNSKQVELVVYPEVPTLPKGVPDEIFEAECVANAHNMTSLQVNVFSDNSSCSDVVEGGARCECDDGYEISMKSTSCEPCPAGRYRTAGINTDTCLECPDNTITSKPQSSVCKCQDEYFRGSEDTINEGCTKPPGQIHNLSIVNTTGNSITLSWDRPVDLGGRDDLHYDVCYTLSICETMCERNCSQHRTTNGSYTTTLEHLVADTRYDITVSTHNGVSNQDHDNDVRRVAEITGRTTEGIPNAPVLKRLCTVVIWQPPTSPAGVIIAYDVRFVNLTGAFEMHTYGGTSNFHLTTKEQRDNHVLVQIRARNSANCSPYTPLLTIDCIPNEGCPTQLPPVCPTAPPCPISTCPTAPPCPVSTCPTAPLCPVSTCPTAPACPTPACPTEPPCLVSTCPTAPPCPVSTCPTTPSCPTSTCPTTLPCPTCATTPACPTCPTMLPCLTCTTMPSCPACPTSAACPACPTSAACPACPTSAACPVCPTTVAPTDVTTVPTEVTTAPAEVTTSPSCNGVEIWLSQQLIVNRSRVSNRAIGRGNAALMVRTNFTSCCKEERVGDCFYPNNTMVGTRSLGHVLFRNRGPKFIRLNRDNNNEEVVPLGEYNCQIPTAPDVMCMVQFNLT